MYHVKFPFHKSVVPHKKYLHKCLAYLSRTANAKKSDDVNDTSNSFYIAKSLLITKQAVSEVKNKGELVAGRFLKSMHDY